MQDIVTVAVPVLGAVVLAACGAMFRLGQKVSQIQTEMTEMHEDQRLMEQRLFDLIRRNGAG
jgi:hypothetical protein